MAIDAPSRITSPSVCSGQTGSIEQFVTHQFSGSCFRISATFDLEVGEDLVDSLEILIRELDLGCLDVGLDPLRIRGSWDWDHLQPE